MVPRDKYELYLHGSVRLPFSWAYSNFARVHARRGSVGDYPRMHSVLPSRFRRHLQLNCSQVWDVSLPVCPMESRGGLDLQRPLVERILL
jgi:hypothetical protein